MKRILNKSSNPAGFYPFLLLTVIIIAVYTLVIQAPAKNYTGLDKILKNGEITFITHKSYHTYYLYNGEPSGFEYDLAQMYADHIGVKLNFIITENWESILPQVTSGTADVAAAGLTVSVEREKSVTFSTPYMQVRQHIVSNRKNLTIKGVEDLGGKTAVVRKGTSYESRLRELQKEGIDIKIQTVTDSPTEQLIKRVASGDIEVTVADTHIALLNRKYYPQGIVGEAISETQNIAWGLNPEARKLRYSINSFLRTTKSNGTFDELYSRHFGGINDFDYVDLMRFHRRLKSRLPKYEKYIKDSADKYGFDWRLITAQAYQESHLRKWAQSSSGAYGIMQLLRRTARSLSVRNIFNPSQNINGGVKQLSKLYRHYQYVGSADDRLYISLASYNAGQGHILDAKKLAKRMGLNPNKWASLVQTLPLLQYKEFYKDAEYGFCRGEEPVKYVRQIVLYYDILKHLSVSNSGEIRLALKDTK